MKQGLLRISLFLIAVLSFSFAKAQTVSGTVTDGSMPIPGVNILVKGTSNGTTTDFDGNFTLNDVASDATLVFSFVGFAQQEVKVNGRSTINITMSEDAAALSEVVVIGYGSTTVKDATGAVATVSAEDFNQGVISSPEELIQGKTAGLQVTSTSGEPGAGVNIRIRGTTSVRGGNNPLFVVDGVPLAGSDTSSGGTDVGFGSSSAKNPLNFLNPSDIESMSVLKDASATAIYGSRGANGVVIITTKSGRGNKGRVEYSTTTSVANAANTYDLLNRDEFLEAVEDLGNDPDAIDFGGDTDWQRAVLRTAFSKNHNLSYSNSYKTGNYRASLSYADQEGIIKNSSMERISGRINFNQRLFDDRLSLNLQTTLSQVKDERAPISNNAGASGDLLGGAYQSNPTYPADPDFQLPGLINPLALLKYNQDKTDTERLLVNFSAEYDIIPDLSAKVNLGYDKSESDRRASISPDILGISGVPGNGRANLNEIDATNRLMEITLNYKKQFENSKIEALVGYSFQDFERKGSNISGFGFGTSNLNTMADNLEYSSNILASNISGSYQQYGYSSEGFFVNRLFPEIATDNLTAPSGINVNSVAFDSFNTTDELQSYFARVNYTLFDKYIFTGTIRADGSTRFGGNNKYGYFPSGAFAWQLAEEDFIPDTFSTLKFRIGYGVTGNQEIPYNQYEQRERYSDIGIGNGGNIVVPGTSLVSFANPDLKWEETSQTNLGLDFGFMRDRLSGSLDFYYKNTTDLLIQVFSAQPSPQPFVYQNLDANIINKGVEFSIDYNIFQTEDFYWNFGFNVAYNHNMVEDFDGIIDTGEINGQGLTGAFAQRLVGGYPLFSYYLREFTGFDENGFNTYEGGDIDNQTFVGKSALPKTNLGISTRFEYKNWDLSAFFTGQYGFYVYNNTANAFFTAGTLSNGRNVTRDVVGNGESPLNAPDVSTRFLERGDFLRMQNATLGYNFNFDENSIFNSLRLYLTGQNLFLITNYSGLDPEVDTNKALNNVPSAGIDYTSYPRPRTYTFGLNVTF
ncbi:MULTISPECIES: SusC/RagA family TonB-linked outer membrane protein [Zunongwangia]|uniref:SusC/RagA family TonB-linked outer membrane protein n=1 Tax=Zunongwangia TaxID=417127 RepID=UPI001D192FF0|nr:TonB-dependent receptor [Zunongwangia profunda]MCC4230611.1 TonB-dependent receptor [Zunongwangia profunda]